MSAWRSSNFCRHTSASDLGSCCVYGAELPFRVPAFRPSLVRSIFLGSLFLALVPVCFLLLRCSRVLYLLLTKVEAPPPFC